MKKILSLIMCLCLIVSTFAFANISTNAATFNDINQSSVFVKQQTNYTCTLASAAMLVRRASMMAGKSNWASVTESSMRSTAWVENSGLKWSFSYNGISVGHGTLSGGSGNKNTLINLLANHPEGIVAYNGGNSNQYHAILLTDYTNGTFYCADPAGSTSGRVALSSSTIKGSGQDGKLASFNAYWYVTSPKLTLSGSASHTHNWYYAGVTSEHPHYRIFKCACGKVDTRISEPCNAIGCSICYGRVLFNADGANIYKGKTSCLDLNGINVPRTANTMVVQTYEYGNPKYTNKYGFEIAVDNTGAIVGCREYGNEAQLYPKKGGFVVSASGDVLQPSLEDIYKWAKYVYCDYLERKIYFYEDVYDFNCFAKGLSKGSAYGRLPFSKKTGYVFEGWYTAKTGGTRIIGKSKYNGVNTLYAHWRKSDKITFSAGGTKIYTDNVYEKNFDDINAPRTNSKIIIYTSEYNNPRYTNCYGYEIAVDANGLIIGDRDYGNENMLEVPDGGFVISCGDLLINSIKELRRGNRYVYFDFENNKLYFYGNSRDYLIGSKSLSIGSEYGVMPSPVRSGYEFIGWFTNVSSGRKITSLSKYSGEKVLYARWRKLNESKGNSATTLSKHKITKTTLSTPKVKITTGKKQFKIKYTKVKNAVGFQVRYKIKGKWKIKNFNTKKSATKVLKGLKKGKYKVQIRSFSKGKKLYSNWTKVKTVKVK